MWAIPWDVNSWNLRINHFFNLSFLLCQINVCWFQIFACEGVFCLLILVCGKGEHTWFHQLDTPDLRFYSTDFAEIFTGDSYESELPTHENLCSSMHCWPSYWPMTFHKRGKIDFLTKNWEMIILKVLSSFTHCNQIYRTNSHIYELFSSEVSFILIESWLRYWPISARTFAKKLYFWPHFTSRVFMSPLIFSVLDCWFTWNFHSIIS